MTEPTKVSPAAVDKSSLAKRHCYPCAEGTPALSAPEIGLLKASVPQWDVVAKEGVATLSRSFDWPDFRSAMAFVNQVAEVAESEAHHPDFVIQYSRVIISSWTHVASGLTENDFILAAKIDALPSLRAAL